MKGLFGRANAGIVRIEAEPELQKTEKSKSENKRGKLPENRAKRDKMEEMAKFRKSEKKTRAGGIV